MCADPNRGVRGRLTATFADGAAGAFHSTSSGPLELRGPFPGALPRFFLRNVTCGIFGGDDYRVDLRAQPGARVHVEPTSATKVYAMPGPRACSSVRLEALPESLLYYSPGLTILQQRSSLAQDVEVVLHPGGVVAYRELVALGRLAHGERLAFSRFTSSLRVHCPVRGPLYQERFDLRPALDRTALSCALGSAGVVGSLFLLGDRAGLLDLLEVGPEVYGGVSTLPNGAGAVVRVLAHRAEEISALFDAVGDMASSLHATGRPAKESGRVAETHSSPRCKGEEIARP